jgi:hypothetical protein
MITKARTTAIVLAASLLTLGGGAITGSAIGSAASSAADQCTGNAFRNADDGDGLTTVGANLKVGPYASCNNVVWMPAGTHVYYWCYISNSYGNTWTYARIAGTQTHGWIVDGKLNDNGALARC